MSQNFYQKQLSDTLGIREVCRRMPRSFTTMAQVLNYHKSQMVIQKKIDFLTKLISNMNLNDLLPSHENEAILHLIELNLPLLWTEDSKRRESATGYGFYVFQNGVNFVETAIIEFNSYQNNLSIQNIKINVNPKTILHVELYYNLIDHNSIKKYLKSKDAASENFNFNLIGKGVIDIQKMIESESDTYILKIPPKKSINIFRTSVNHSPKKGSSLSFSAINTKSDQTSYYGTKLHYFFHCGIIFKFMPIIKSDFNRFSATLKLKNFSGPGCVNFQDYHILFYKMEISFLDDPIEKFKIDEIYIREGKNKINVEIFRSDNEFLGYINFRNSENITGFLNFFEKYRNSIKVWGTHVEFGQPKNQPSFIIKEIAKNPELALKLLRPHSEFTNIL